MPITTSEEVFFELVATGPEFGIKPKHNILVEGDSWVSHPFLNNLADQINLLGKDDFAVLNMAAPGDTAGNMFSKDSRQLKDLDRLIYNKRFGYKFAMIFISAAGNDIVGPEIKGYVDDHGTGGRSGADLINSSFDRTLKRVAKNYEYLLRVRDKSRINKDTPVICQCYSYMKPRKVGTKVFGAMFGKGWVKRYLDKKSIPKEDQQIIISTMLDRFHDSIKGLENKYSNFLVVDTRQVLSRNGKPTVSLWHDEIHPTGAGFRKVAKVIRESAKSRSMWPNN